MSENDKMDNGRGDRSHIHRNERDDGEAEAKTDVTEEVAETNVVETKVMDRSNEGGGLVMSVRLNGDLVEVEEGER